MNKPHLNIALLYRTYFATLNLPQKLVFISSARTPIFANIYRMQLRCLSRSYPIFPSTWDPASERRAKNLYYSFQREKAILLLVMFVLSAIQPPHHSPLFLCFGLSYRRAGESYLLSTRYALFISTETAGNSP